MTRTLAGKLGWGDQLIHDKKLASNEAQRFSRLSRLALLLRNLNNTY